MFIFSVAFSISIQMQFCDWGSFSFVSVEIEKEYFIIFPINWQNYLKREKKKKKKHVLNHFTSFLVKRSNWQFSVHYSVHHSVANHYRAKLEIHFYVSYSSDLLPSDYHLFSSLSDQKLQIQEIKKNPQKLELFF